MKKLLVIPFLIISALHPTMANAEEFPPYVSNYGGNYNGYPKLPEQYYNLVKEACYKYYKNDVPSFPCLENAIAQMSVENTNYIHNLGSSTGDYGLVQINLYWNKNVSYSQAIDPNFAIDWMVWKMGTLGAQSVSFDRALCKYNTGSAYSSCVYSRKVLERRRVIFGI